MKDKNRRLSFLISGILAVLAVSGFFLAQKKTEAPLTWSQALEQYIGSPAYKTVDPRRPLKEQTSVFEIAGRIFEMPTVYIQSNIAGKRVLEDGINLIYVLPGYTSRADFASRQEYEEARKAKRFAHMLLEPEVEDVTFLFDKMVESRRQGTAKQEKAGIFDGLESEKWYLQRGDQLVFYYEIFLEKDEGGHVVSWIECSTLERAPFPGCSHRFRDNKLRYRIYYNKEKFFNEWRAQRESAIKFIDGFDITAKNTITEGQ